MSFTPIYVPVGAPTFHLETAGDQFEKSKALLSRLDQGFVLPDEMLLTMDKLCAFLDRVHPDAIVFQNNTFANAAFITEVRRRFDCPILIWTLREPVIDGGRLRLNSLTGAYSAANAMANLGDESFSYIFGAPDEARTENAIAAFLAAGRVKKAMRSLRIAAVGHTPQGFGFGRALDTDLSRVFGAEPRPRPSALTKRRSATVSTTRGSTRRTATISAKTASARSPRGAGRISSPTSARPSARC